MDEVRRTAWTRRRIGLAASGVLAAILGGVPGTLVAAKHKKPKKPGKALCRPNGAPCSHKKGTCSRGNCLQDGFTAEATFSGDFIYEAYLFVPPLPGSGATGTFISSAYGDMPCTADASDCEDNVYPFACTSQDEQYFGPIGTSVRQYLKGTYQYWVYVVNSSAAGAVAVTLRNTSNGVVRTWSSPANPNDYYIGWHVFDVDGSTGAVTSVDRAPTFGLPPLTTDVCPR
jgi:hypothetical protein